jgi:hypothetical protein
MRFFPKGLNSFEIQISFKLDFLLNFIIQNPEGFGNWAKNESCPFWSNLSPCKVLKFLEFYKCPYYILQV